MKEPRSTMQADEITTAALRVAAPVKAAALRCEIA